MKQYRGGKTKWRAGVAAVFLAAFSAVPGGAAEFDAARICEVPEEMGSTSLPLPRLAARLAAGEEVRIVVMGSGSSSGLGASRKANAYPERLAGELGKRFPSA